MRYVTSLALLLSALVLTSCLEDELVLTVKKDGSGEIVKTTKFRFDPPMDAESAKLLRAQAQAFAARFGPDVRMTGFKDENLEDGWQRIVATYEVPDVRTLELVYTFIGDPTGGQSGKGIKVGFLDQPDGTRKVEFMMPPGPNPDEVKKVPVDPEQLPRLQPGARLGVSVRVEGEMVETDCSHVDKEAQKVALMAIEITERTRRVEIQNLDGTPSEAGIFFDSPKILNGEPDMKFEPRTRSSIIFK